MDKQSNYCAQKKKNVYKHYKHIFLYKMIESIQRRWKDRAEGAAAQGPTNYMGLN